MVVEVHRLVPGGHAAPLLSGGLGDVGDAHAGLGDAGAGVREPEHVRGLRSLRGVRVLLRPLRLLKHPICLSICPSVHLDY